jgi:hypothetical protein
MKNIKDITISIFAIIGFAFLLSSFTPNDVEETTQNQVGTYQVSTTYRDMGNWIFETIIDTRTGKVVSRERHGGFSEYKK